MHPPLRPWRSVRLVLTGAFPTLRGRRGSSFHRVWRCHLPVTATLPATDGLTHVAFAVKPISGPAVVPLTLTVNYTPTDSFVEVIPPDGQVQTAMTVTYTPGSETTGAEVTPVNSVNPAPGFTLVVSQAGRSLTQRAICDFPSELSCVGGVTPGEPVTARLSGPAGPVILNLAWK